MAIELNQSYDIFSKIEQVLELPKSELNDEHKNIFPYCMYPAKNFNSYNEFKTELSTAIQKYVENKDENTYKCPTYILNKNINTIYTIITYPVANAAIFKFTTHEPVTYGILLYAYTLAYQLMYKLEEQDDCDPGHIPGMLNRMESAGRFGIWGHDIGDLVYNGYSTIGIYDDYITCEFDCDS